MRRRHVIVASITAMVIALGAAWFVTAPSANAAAAGLWKIDCGFSHSLPDDPIVHPNKPGASHLHDFFGNVGTKASTTTYESLKDVTSTCANKDRAAYWTPALYRNGRKIDPNGAILYYTTSAGDPKKQIAYPADMRIIVGNAQATTAKQQTARVEWGCSDNTNIGQAVPKTCKSGNIQVRIRFPGCWDGKMDAGNNATRHVAYPASGKCPAGFPHALPNLRMNVQYRTGTDVGAITLSSGSVHSIHADFMNIWDQPTLEGLVKRCFHGQTNCGRFRGNSPGRNP